MCKVNAVMLPNWAYIFVLKSPCARVFRHNMEKGVCTVGKEGKREETLVTVV